MRRVFAIVIASVMLCASVCARPPVAQIFDTFGDICCDDEKARLDNFAMALDHRPGAIGYIVFYGGRRYNTPWCSSRRETLAYRGQSAARAARLKPYLVNTRLFDSNRLVVIDGGYREAWTAELWIVPEGANPPTPTPTLKPQDIRFRKGRVPRGHYVCGV